MINETAPITQKALMAVHPQTLIEGRVMTPLVRVGLARTAPPRKDVTRGRGEQRTGSAPELVEHVRLRIDRA